MSKKGYGENVIPANIPRKYVATVWLNLFSYAVAIFFPVCRHGEWDFSFMEGVVTHDFRFRLEEPTKKENQQVTAVKAPLVA